MYAHIFFTVIAFCILSFSNVCITTANSIELRKKLAKKDKTKKTTLIDTRERERMQRRKQRKNNITANKNEMFIYMASMCINADDE